MEKIEERINQIVEGHAECRWLDASELRAYLEQIAAEQRAIDAHEMNFATKRIVELESFVKRASILIKAEKAFSEHLESENKKLIDKACNAFCHTGCPHKTDSFDCLNNKCDTWKIFKSMLEE